MLEIDIGTVIFSIVTFALLVLLLRRFLYKPVLSMLDQRRQAVNEALDQADRTRLEAQQADVRLQEQIAATRLEADRILAEAKAKAEENAAQVLRQAKSDAERISAQAAADIELERERALAELREQAADLALLAAEKALASPLTDSQQQALLDSFVEQVGKGSC
ncbi:MAG: F0F1 ATP synthase subunit B [Firmicutes bacterium]|nr:F0F1 ATP synthase subunit B [Bacillota bacterium]